MLVRVRQCVSERGRVQPLRQHTSPPESRTLTSESRKPGNGTDRPVGCRFRAHTAGADLKPAALTARPIHGIRLPARGNDQLGRSACNIRRLSGAKRESIPRTEAGPRKGLPGSLKFFRSFEEAPLAACQLARCIRNVSQAFSASANVLKGEPPTLMAGLFR
jgi:hypothetical protein